jgi:UMP-CMP kinase
VASKSATADLINGYMKDGKIVPSKLVVEILKRAIDATEADTVLVDGFPRALDQVKKT